jgi:hypothetical protein
MKYLVPSLRIVEFKGMEDTIIVQDKIVQWMELEGDKFIAGFHQQVKKE